MAGWWFDRLDTQTVKVTGVQQQSLNRPTKLQEGKFDWERDSSASGRRLSSERLKKVEQQALEAEEASDKTPVLIAGGAFFAVIIIGLAAAVGSGFDGTPRV